MSIINARLPINDINGNYICAQRLHREIRDNGHVGTTTEKTNDGNQLLTVVIHRYLKLTSASLTAKTVAAQVATIFLDNWLMPYGRQSYLLTDNGQKFVEKLFKTLRSLLSLKKLTKLSIHPN